MSIYADARSTPWTSTYHTALEFKIQPIIPQARIPKNALRPPFRNIKAIKRLQQKEIFDPRSTDSKHPSTPSLLPRLEDALRVHKCAFADTKWSRNLSSYPAYVADGNAREGLLPSQDSLHAMKGKTPHRVVKTTPELTLPLPRRRYRHGISSLARRLYPSDTTISSDPEPKILQDVRKLVSQRERTQLESIHFSSQEVERLCFGSDQRSAHQPKSITQFVINPPKCIPEEEFWDSDVDRAKPEDQRLWQLHKEGAVEISPDAPRSSTLAALFKHKTEALQVDINDSKLRQLNNNGVVQISPDAPRSAVLAAFLKHKTETPQIDINRRFYIPRSLCVRAKAQPRSIFLGWRPCTYEELTWIEMMDRLMDLEGYSSQDLGQSFGEKSGMELPVDWKAIPKMIYQYPMIYKRDYMGWYPELVGWKRRSVVIPRLRESENT